MKARATENRSRERGAHPNQADTLGPSGWEKSTTGVVGEVEANPCRAGSLHTLRGRMQEKKSMEGAFSCIESVNVRINSFRDSWNIGINPFRDSWDERSRSCLRGGNEDDWMMARTRWFPDGLAGVTGRSVVDGEASVPR